MAIYFPITDATTMPAHVSPFRPESTNAGAGAGSDPMRNAADELMKEHFPPQTTPINGDAPLRVYTRFANAWSQSSNPEVGQAFYRLRDEWKRGRQSISSSIKKSVEHPAYRAIVKLDKPALRFIMSELEKNPDWWFSALREITKEDPVPLRSRGDLHEMTTHWLRWGRAKNVII